MSADVLYAFMIGAGGGYVSLIVARNIFLEIDASGLLVGSLAIGMIVAGWVGLSA